MLSGSGMLYNLYHLLAEIMFHSLYFHQYNAATMYEWLQNKNQFQGHLDNLRVSNLG